MSSREIRKAVRRYAKKYRHLFDADDLSQESLLSLDQATNLPATPPPVPWVIRIVSRRAVDLARRRAGKDLQLESPDLVSVIATDYSALQSILEAMRTEHPEFDKLVEFWWTEPTVKEHAAYLGKTETAVKEMRAKFREKAAVVKARLEADWNR